jgi:NADPH-dependent curcumin reductase CurA
VVAVSYLSVDPAMRRRIDAAFRRPIAIGAVMETGAVGRVISSKHPEFAVGEHVYGGFGVPDFARSDGTRVFKLAPVARAAADLSGGARHHWPDRVLRAADVGRLREDETVVISGAAGAVGSVAGQIAKIKGAG